MIPNSSAAVTTPTLTQRAHNIEFACPRFGTPLRRISASTLGLTFSAPGDGLHSEYPQLSATNADDTLILFTQGGGIKGGGVIVDQNNPSQILHTINYQTGLSIAHDGAALRWDPVVPNRLWFWQTIAWNNFQTTCSSSAGSALLTNVSITTGMASGDTLHVLGAGALNAQGNPGMLKGVILNTTSNSILLDTTATFSTTNVKFAVTPRLCRYDLNTSTIPYTRTVTIERDFTEYFLIEHSGSSTLWTGALGGSASASWEEMSDDGAWIAAYATLDGTKQGYTYVSNSTPGSLTALAANSNHEVFSYNVHTRVKVVMNINDAPGSHSVTQGGTLGAAYSPYGTTNAVDSIDWVAMSPSGTYVVVNHNTNNWLQAGGNWDKYGGAVCYRADTGAFAGKLTGSTGHGDLINYNGDEYLVIDSSNVTNSPFSSSHLIAYRLPESIIWSGTPYTTAGVNIVGSYANGGVIKLWDHQYANIHVSARNFKDPSFVIVECYGNETLTNFENEIVKVYMNSRVGESGNAPNYERMFHFRSTAINYYNRAHPSVSKNGEFIVFGSDWNNSNQLMDGYIADINWFKHFDNLKTFRKGPLQTNFDGLASGGGDRLGGHNGWKGIACTLGTDRTKDGIYLMGFNSDAAGRAASFFSNGTWRHDPNFWRMNLILPADITTFDGNGNDSVNHFKVIRRVQNDTTGTVIQFSAGAVQSMPSWVVGVDHLKITNYRGDVIRAQNLGISALSSTHVTLGQSVTVSKDDIIYLQGEVIGPCATWHSWDTKPWHGHPYNHVVADIPRKAILQGPCNSGKPDGQTSHIKRYTLAGNVWDWVHTGFWTSNRSGEDNSSGRSTLLGMDDVGTSPVPDGVGESSFGYSHISDETVSLDASQGLFKNGSASPPNKTYSVNCTTGVLTSHASTSYHVNPNADPINPGSRCSAAFPFDSKRNRQWLIGGFTLEGNSYSTLDHAWYWDYVTHLWTRVSLTGTIPTARTGTWFAYDSESDVICIASGTNSGSGESQQANADWLSDAYLLDLTTLVWERLPDIPFEWTAHGNVSGVSIQGTNLMCYMPQPFNCLALLNLRAGYGPGTDISFDNVYDPNFIFLRVSGQVETPPVEPPPPEPSAQRNPTTIVVFSQL